MHFCHILQPLTFVTLGKANTTAPIITMPVNISRLNLYFLKKGRNSSCIPVKTASKPPI